MQPAENKDYSRDVILRLSPTRNTIIVEEQKPGGIAAYREIDPLELYYVKARRCYEPSCKTAGRGVYLLSAVRFV